MTPNDIIYQIPTMQLINMSNGYLYKSIAFWIPIAYNNLYQAMQVVIYLVL
jgi:hypothetical protein